MGAEGRGLQRFWVELGRLQEAEETGNRHGEVAGREGVEKADWRLP